MYSLLFATSHCGEMAVHDSLLFNKARTLYNACSTKIKPVCTCESHNGPVVAALPGWAWVTGHELRCLFGL